MKRVFICDLKDGDQFQDVLLVREKQSRTNRNGQLYLQMQLDDRTGSISARYWNATEEEIAGVQLGDYLTVHAKSQLYQNQMQLIVHDFQKADTTHIDQADFLPTSDHDLNELENELRSQLQKIQNPTCNGIAQAFLLDEDLMHSFVHSPAGIKTHHAFIGGLMHHVVTMLNVYDRISDLYPQINPCMFRLGIFLHDIGKIRELAFDRVFQYTTEGQLLGHLAIGIELLNDKLLIAQELVGEQLDQSVVQQLKHLILSHHGTYEFGSPKLPMTIEAIALHYLDNFDAKIYQFDKLTENTGSDEEPWTGYEQNLQRKLYRNNRM